MMIVVIQSTVQCCKFEPQLDLTSHLITAHHTVFTKLAYTYCMHREAQDRESVYIDRHGVINPWSIL